MKYAAQQKKMKQFIRFIGHFPLKDTERF